MAEWGNITWVMLHSLSANIKEVEFEKNKKEILNFIYLVIEILPCRICSKHGIIYLNENNFFNIINKEELVNFIFIFHNNTNMRLNKPIKNIKYINRYYLTNIKIIFQLFLDIFPIKNDIINNFISDKMYLFY